MTLPGKLQRLHLSQLKGTNLEHIILKVILQDIHQSYFIEVIDGILHNYYNNAFLEQ